MNIPKRACGNHSPPGGRGSTADEGKASPANRKNAGISAWIRKRRKKEDMVGFGLLFMNRQGLSERVEGCTALDAKNRDMVRGQRGRKGLPCRCQGGGARQFHGCRYAARPPIEAIRTRRFGPVEKREIGLSRRLAEKGLAGIVIRDPGMIPEVERNELIASR